ncbi:hypothetical protein [Sphingomonas sp.]|jgi:hypothetical protein|uniref:hypothetical protein n=1 Tax=Sphingomonas sp. TaxID=28214 RepID=UPI002ED7E785
MRLTAIAGLCLLAAPAVAQRVDTRVIDTRQMADGRQRCTFNAVRDLHMTEARRGARDAFAEWAHKARDGNAWLHARFSRQEREGSIQMIEVPLTKAIARAASAQVFIDASPSPVPFALKRRPRSDRWTLIPGDGVALARAMRYTDILSVRLLGPRGQRLASYEFWIGDLQDVAEYPAIIGWTCAPGDD